RHERRKRDRGPESASRLSSVPVSVGKEITLMLKHAVFLATLLVVAAAGTAGAQTNRGALAGTVFDQSGGVLPGATVTVVDLGTNGTRTTVTSANGTYTVSNLEPVVYRVVVDLAGFKTASLQPVKVDTAATATANVTLQTGAVEAQVTVTAAPALIRDAG